MSILVLGEPGKLLYVSWFVIKQDGILQSCQIYLRGEGGSKSRPASGTNQLTLIEVFPKIKLRHIVLSNIIVWLRSRVMCASDFGISHLSQILCHDLTFPCYYLIQNYEQ